MNAKADKIYLLGYEGGTVSVLDGASGAISRWQAGMHAWSIAVNETTGTVFRSPEALRWLRIRRGLPPPSRFRLAKFLALSESIR